jgi:hypothetical protein
MRHIGAGQSGHLSRRRTNVPLWCGSGTSALVVGRGGRVIGYRVAVTLVQTLLVLFAVPAAVYGVITLAIMWPRLTRRTRYRTGQDWNFAPVYWVANPATLDLDEAALARGEGAHDARPSTATGGARGNW